MANRVNWTQSIKTLEDMGEKKITSLILEQEKKMIKKLWDRFVSWLFDWQKK